MMEWNKFGKTPIFGTYWIAGCRPVYDPENKSQSARESFVSLVEIEFEPSENKPQWIESVIESSVDSLWAGDCLGYGCTITHDAPFEIPEPPECDTETCS